MDSPEKKKPSNAIESAKLVWKTPSIEVLNVRDTKGGLINAGFETNFLFNQQCDFQFCQS